MCGDKFKSFHRIQQKTKMVHVHPPPFYIACNDSFKYSLYKIQSALRLACENCFLESSPVKMGILRTTKQERVQSVKIPPSYFPPPLKKTGERNKEK